MPLLHGLVDRRGPARHLAPRHRPVRRRPLLTHGVEWFAVAGAAVLLNRVDDTLGEVGK
ncbi:hypothetical protein ABZY09_36290 [Streptomyces sp. NPDC002928]|uniref:hypothetical protein n=1 Tax=Streptomyces sp. NPDC002928 TaxID=3154440 RepID=UPI0033A22227